MSGAVVLFHAVVVTMFAKQLRTVRSFYVHRFIN